MNPPFATAHVGRFARTAVQLRSGQVGQRLRLRAQQLALDSSLPGARRWLLAGPAPGSAVGWPVAFTPVDEHLGRSGPSGTVLRGGALSLLGVARVVAPAGRAGLPDWLAADWEMAGAPLLWRFHLYYWDWIWTLAAQPRSEARALFAAMWASWRAGVVPGRRPAWHPYPAALRAWSFCGIYRELVQGSTWEEPFRADLATHTGFLRRSLETDVGGNHLIKNLKALAGLAVFFADDALLRSVLGRLRRQLAVQVLPDGGHFERAPAYHCQVLGDLIDVADLLSAAGEEAPAELPAAITAMRCWLGAVLTPAGDVPLLNDGFPVSPELLAALRPATSPVGPLHVLPDTGLARAAVGRWHLLADIGLPCPRELPAHAHADTLGCLVSVDSEPLLVDTGTSGYEPGAVRDYERSTAAHNTLEVDRTDSTEVWGAFRAGRRARITNLSVSTAGDSVTITASHDGYRHLPGRPAHHRRWQLGADELRIDDTVTGRGRHTIAVRWHLAPDTLLRLVPAGAVVTAKAGDFAVTVAVTAGGTVSAPGASTHAGAGAIAAALTAETAEISTGFGRTVSGPVLSCIFQSGLPVRISTIWRPAASAPNPQEEPA